MEFTIKKKTLGWIIVATLVVLVCGGFAFHKYNEKRKAELAVVHFVQSYNKAVDREYKSLVRDYKRLVEGYNEASYYGRDYYEKELRKLLGKEFYYYPSTPTSEIEEILKEKARANVLLDE